MKHERFRLSPLTKIDERSTMESRHPYLHVHQQSSCTIFESSNRTNISYDKTICEFFRNLFEREGLISSTSSTVTNPLTMFLYTLEDGERERNGFPKIFGSKEIFTSCVTCTRDYRHHPRGRVTRSTGGRARGGNKFRQRRSVIQCHRCPKRVYDKSDARRIVGRNTTPGRNLYLVCSFLFDRS